MRLDKCEHADVPGIKEWKNYSVRRGTNKAKHSHKGFSQCLSTFSRKPCLSSGCYNAGFENIKIIDIAKKVQEKTGANIDISESNDPRSYRQDSTKLLATGFEPKHH